MLAKVLAKGFCFGENTYMKSGWNVMDGCLVIVSLIDMLITLTARSSPKIFGIFFAKWLMKCYSMSINYQTNTTCL